MVVGLSSLSRGLYGERTNEVISCHIVCYYLFRITMHSREFPLAHNRFIAKKQYKFLMLLPPTLRPLPTTTTIRNDGPFYGGESRGIGVEAVSIPSKWRSSLYMWTRGLIATLTRFFCSTLVSHPPSLSSSSSLPPRHQHHILSANLLGSRTELSGICRCFRRIYI